MIADTFRISVFGLPSASRRAVAPSQQVGLRLPRRLVAPESDVGGSHAKAGPSDLARPSLSIAVNRLESLSIALKKMTLAIELIDCPWLILFRFPKRRWHFTRRRAKVSHEFPGSAATRAGGVA